MSDSIALDRAPLVSQQIRISSFGEQLVRLRRFTRFLDAGARPFFDLATRFWLAQLFFVSGFIKLTNWDTALFLAEHEYPVSWLDPVTTAQIGVAIEICGALLLAIGLLTRPAAIALLALTAVSQFVYVQLNAHVYWIVLLAWLAVMGAGGLSLDHLLTRGIAGTALPGVRFMAAIYRAATRYVGPIYLLGLRLLVATILVIGGAGTVGDLAGGGLALHVHFSDDLLPPEVPALALAFLTAVVPTLLAAGLATRAAAIFGLLLLSGIAASMATNTTGFVDLAYCGVILGLVATRGGGVLSLDHLANRALRSKFPQLDDKPAFDLAGTPRVVIVGAGFGGIQAARSLRHVPCRVTLIDRRNYHLFQPLLYQVATATLSPGDIATPIRSMFASQHNVRVALGRVTGIDQSRREVVTPDRRYPYDYLIVATGARHSYYGKDEWESVAPGLKKIDDATDIRRRLLLAFEKAENTDDPEERARLLTFVVVGGGPTGVELAGAIAELAKHGMRQEFTQIDPSLARVVLVQGGDRVLPTFPESLSTLTEQTLRDLGVEVQTGHRVGLVDDAGVVVGGERIAARTVFWAAGVIASAASKWLDAKADHAGRVHVEPDLSVPGQPTSFVIGDTAASSGWDGKQVPGLAPAAKQAGSYVADLIRRRITGECPPPPFRYKHAGNLATIGRKAAVADLGWLRLGGAPAWWFWGAVHVMFLADARSRFAVSIEWLWAYLTFKRSTRLITGGEA